jgi:hypothetical protein
MARRRGLSCNDVLACLDVLSDVDSEHENDIEDSLSWDESDPESNEVSDSYSEMSASVSPNPTCSRFGSVSFRDKQKHYHRQLLQCGQFDPVVKIALRYQNKNTRISRLSPSCSSSKSDLLALISL